MRDLQHDRKKTRFQIRRSLITPTLVVLGISLVLITVNLLITQHTYSYDSDDVSWQTTLLTWKPFSGQHAFVGAKDNFLINAPLILLFGHIFHTSRAQLLAEAITFALLNFLLFYIAALYFLRKARIRPTYATLVPFVWLASFGAGFTINFLNTNWRDFEFGASFIFYMLAAKYYYGEIAPHRSVKARLWSLVVLGISTLFTYSDPYFFYLVLLPVTVFFGVLWALKKTSREKTLLVAAFSLISLAASRLLMSVFARAGLLAPPGALTPTALHNVRDTLTQLMAGMGNFFGIDFPHNVLLSIGGILMLGAIAYSMLRLLATIRRSAKERAAAPDTVMLWFFSLLAVFSLMTYVAVVNGVGTNRYLVPFVYVATLLVALSLPRFRKGLARAVVVAMAALVVLNMASGISHLGTSKAEAAAVNRGNYQLIAAIKRQGYTKGYAGYWDGNINTYLSDNTVTFLPVTCDGRATIPLALLVNGGLFGKTTGKTFLVLDPLHKTPRLCSEKKIFAQFGQPQRELKVGSDTVLFYNYDLITRMYNAL